MLPSLNTAGDLPDGIHTADWHEIKEHFGRDSAIRERTFSRLQHLHTIAESTGKLTGFFIFGRFVSAKPDPRDVDVVLVMDSDFRVEDSPRECRTLFSHADAETRYGASIFWIRDGMLTDAMKAGFFETWQTKRAGSKRGIIQVIRP
jgi:hypothetical protein